MHIRIVARAALPGGGIANPGTVLDLPEAEAAPLLDGGLAEPWPPAPEAPAEPAPEPDPNKPAEG
ncbi:hypothetical protein [Synechococcus phage MinM1]|nr:hypothetical protein [Synechococcus phage MinM1]